MFVKNVILHSCKRNIIFLKNKNNNTYRDIYIYIYQ